MNSFATDILDEIVARKQRRLEQARSQRPLSLFREAAKQMQHRRPQHAMRRALERDEGINVIAEIKHASPSKGMIKQNFKPAELAKAFERGGAAALSVLTEEDFFQGCLDDLRAVRQISSLPILRKDFIIDEYQIYEAAEAGADAVLLIAAILSDAQLASFRRMVEDELGMDALVEVHNAGELRRAQLCGATLIGVNNRDLRTFEVSLQFSTSLAHKANEKTLLVSESGLRSAHDLRRLKSLGFNGFLIGETLMRAADPSVTLQRLIRESEPDLSVRIKVCGITTLKDAATCVYEGVDFLGFNFYRPSPRYIAPENARRIIQQLPQTVMSVGVFVNESSPNRVAAIADRAGVSAVQLHGDETPSYCRTLNDRYVIKAFRVGKDFVPEQIAQYRTGAVLLDAFSAKAPGGTGQAFNWSVARHARQFTSKLFLAGGITPENVPEAIEVVRPYAIDVCSGVEFAPGRKDPKRIAQLVAATKGCSSVAAGK